MRVSYFILYFFGFFYVSILNLNSQEKSNNKDLVEVYGIVKGSDSIPMPYVYVINISRSRASFSDKSGLFSVLGHPGDTVIFSHLGFMNDTTIVKYDGSLKYYARDIYLIEDTFLLSVVDIYPWSTWSEFKRTFLELEVDSKEMENARKNVEFIILAIENELDIPPDAALNYKASMNQMFNQRMKYYNFPYVSILNPFAWMQFFEAIQRGDFKKD